MNVLPQISSPVNSSNPLSVTCKIKSQSEIPFAGQSFDVTAASTQPFEVLLNSLISHEPGTSPNQKSKTIGINSTIVPPGSTKQAKLPDKVPAKSGHLADTLAVNLGTTASLTAAGSHNSVSDLLDTILGIFSAGREKSGGVEKQADAADAATQQFEPSKTNSTYFNKATGLIILPFIGTVQISDNSQSLSRNQQSETGDNSTMEQRLSDISRQLLTLLTNTQSSPDGNSSTQNAFMAKIAKNVMDDLASKPELLELLYNSPTSSINKDFSTEVEKILSEISNTGSDAVSYNEQSELSLKSIENTLRTAVTTYNTGKIHDESTLQGQPIKISSGQSDINDATAIATGSRVAAIDNQAAKNISTVISQEVPPLSVPTNKVFNNHGIQNAGKGSSPVQAPAKIAVKASSETGTQSSSSNGTYRGKSENDPAPKGSSWTDLIKQETADVYGSGSTDSQVDSQFKEIVSGATHPTDGTDVAKPDASQVAQTIIREAKLMVQQDKTVVNIKLEPESLGSVVLKVSSVDGKISAEFNVKSTDARAYLEASIPQMKEALQTNGVSLSHLSVSLSGGDAQSKQYQYQSKKSHRVNFAGMMDMAPESEESTSAYGISQRSFGYNTMEVKI